MNKSLLSGLVSILETIIAITIGYLYRGLIEALATTFLPRVPTTWITLIFAIPVLLILVKVHFAFRKWLGRKGWLVVDKPHPPRDRDGTISKS